VRTLRGSRFGWVPAVCNSRFRIPGRGQRQAITPARLRIEPSQSESPNAERPANLLPAPQATVSSIGLLACLSLPCASRKKARNFRFDLIAYARHERRHDFQAAARADDFFVLLDSHPLEPSPNPRYTNANVFVSTSCGEIARQSLVRQSQYQTEPGQYKQKNARGTLDSTNRPRQPYTLEAPFVSKVRGGSESTRSFLTRWAIVRSKSPPISSAPTNSFRKCRASTNPAPCADGALCLVHKY
jgi:hypothetical protein